MPSAPYFSVIIPTRDRADKLARALESVTGQTDQDHEIIVVDDGSRDHEARRIAGLVGAIRNATLICNPVSLGAPRSRNIAVTAAQGRVIALLDSDDWWPAERLAAHRSVLGETPCGVISYNPAQLIDEAGRIVGYSNRDGPVSHVAAAAWVAGANGLGGCSSVCVERSIYDAVGGFRPDLPSCQDWDLWFRLVDAGALILPVESVLTYQDCGPHQRISNQRDRVEQGHEKVMAAILKNDWSAGERRYIEAKHTAVRAWIAHSFGEPLEALRLACRAWLNLRDRFTSKTVLDYAFQLLRA